jgi:hypothetical protein
MHLAEEDECISKPAQAEIKAALAKKPIFDRQQHPACTLHKVCTNLSCPVHHPEQQTTRPVGVGKGGVVDLARGLHIKVSDRIISSPRMLRSDVLSNGSLSILMNIIPNIASD